jgi:hypothetical protein
VLTILAWPYGFFDLQPTSGFDPSWSASLQIGAAERLQYGTHVAFAYGPLGFLSVWPIYVPIVSFLAWLYLVAMSTAVFATLVWALRRTAPLVLAVVVAYLAGAIAIDVVSTLYTGGPEKSLPLAFVACIYILACPADEEIPTWVWLGLGAWAAFFFLVKMSLGIGVAIAVAITIACLVHGRRRALGLASVGAVVTFAIGWFATGNGISNLIAFARSTENIISGYSAAVSVEDASRVWTYWWALAVILLLGGFTAAHCRRLGRRAQVGTVIATLVVTWLLFEEGFVRHDAYHDPVFFAAVPLLVAAFVPSSRRWLWSLGGVLAATGVACVVAGSVPSLVARPWTAAHNFTGELVTQLSPGRRAGVTAVARAGLQGTYLIPNSILARTAGQTVDVDPAEQTAVWAYPQMRFDPLPGLQGYSTYTTYLDDLDARFVRSPAAPRYILREPPEVFASRDPWFEPPSTQVAMTCHYRQVLAEGGWQLLERTANRCGPLHRLATVSAGLGQIVPVPAVGPGETVVASVHLPLSLWWHVTDEFFKPPAVQVTVDGTAQYRFVTGTAASLHMMTPASTLGYAAAFAPPTVSSVQFGINGQGLGTSGVTVTFYAMAVSSASSGGR